VESFDPVSGAVYRLWAINNEARFSLQIPAGVVAGCGPTFKIMEAGSAPSTRHKWRLTASLLKAGTTSSSQLAGIQSYEWEYTASDQPDRLTQRTIAITAVGAARFESGDLLACALKRVPASSNEDPGDVRVYAMLMDFPVSETRVSQCSGRVGSIIDTVRDLFNDEDGGFLTDAFILRALNRCRADLAAEGFWRASAWVPAEQGLSSVQVRSSLPDLVRVTGVRYGPEQRVMKPLSGPDEAAELVRYAGPGAPVAYLYFNGILEIHPAPDRDSAQGFLVSYSRIPPELTCSDLNCDPALPESADMLFVFWALKDAFLRDRHAPGAELKYRAYEALYAREKERITELLAGVSPRIRAPPA
jgi:hypothetical protein